LNKRKEQIIQILIAVVAFFVFAIAAIIIVPMSFISYSFTQLKIRTRKLRKKLRSIYNGWKSFLKYNSGK